MTLSQSDSGFTSGQPDSAGNAKTPLPRRFRRRHLFLVAGLLILLVCLGVGLWSQSGDYRTLGQHPQSVIALAFSSDGQTLYSGCRDTNNARTAGTVWETAGRERHKFPSGSGATLSPNGQLIATIDRESRTITVWDTETAAKRAALQETTAKFWRMAFSVDGSFLTTTGAASDGQAGELGLWEIATAKKVRGFKIKASQVTGLSFALDGKAIAASDWNGSAHLWELKGGTELATFWTREKGGGGIPNAVAFSPDGRYLAVPSGATVLIWEVTTRELLATLPTGGYGPLHCLAFSPDGRFLAAGGNYSFLQYYLRGGMVTLWEVGTWRKCFQKKGRINGDTIYCVAFSPDGSRLAIGSYGGYVGVMETDR
jgi:WD40 repeat protein